MPLPLPAARCALTAPFHPYLPKPRKRECRTGGLLSVALSLGLPPPGVTRLRLPMEPGLSSTYSAQRMKPRSSDRLARFRLYCKVVPSSCTPASRQQMLENRLGRAISNAVHTSLAEMALKRPHNSFALLAIMSIDRRTIAKIEEVFLQRPHLWARRAEFKRY